MERIPENDRKLSQKERKCQKGFNEFGKKHEFQKGMIVPLAKMKRTGYNESHGTDL
jgi:hypothetical protein